MITLAGICSRFPRAVERDVIHEGYHLSDIGHGLSFSEFVSIVLAAPRDSAVRWAIDGGWSQEAHLLANQQEQQAGLLDLGARYPRPGVEAEPVDDRPAPERLTAKDIGHVRYDTFDSIDELEERRQAIYAEHRRIAEGGVS